MPSKHAISQYELDHISYLYDALEEEWKKAEKAGTSFNDWATTRGEQLKRQAYTLINSKKTNDKAKFYLPQLAFSALLKQKQESVNPQFYQAEQDYIMQISGFDKLPDKDTIVSALSTIMGGGTLAERNFQYIVGINEKGVIQAPDNQYIPQERIKEVMKHANGYKHQYMFDPDKMEWANDSLNPTITIPATDLVVNPVPEQYMLPPIEGGLENGEKYITNPEEYFGIINQDAGKSKSYEINNRTIGVIYGIVSDAEDAFDGSDKTLEEFMNGQFTGTTKLTQDNKKYFDKDFKAVNAYYGVKPDIEKMREKFFLETMKPNDPKYKGLWSDVQEREWNAINESRKPVTKSQAEELYKTKIDMEKEVLSEEINHKVGKYLATRKVIDGRNIFSKIFHPIRTYRESQFLKSQAQELGTMNLNGKALDDLYDMVKHPSLQHLKFEGYKFDAKTKKMVGRTPIQPTPLEQKKIQVSIKEAAENNLSASNQKSKVQTFEKNKNKGDINLSDEI